MASANGLAMEDGGALEEILKIMVLSGVFKSNFHNLQVMTYVVGFTGANFFLITRKLQRTPRLRLQQLTLRVALFEFLERKQLLQTKKEQDVLFSAMPKVVAEELAPEVQTVDALDENVVEQERENSCSPKSTPNGASDISGAGDTVIPSSMIFVNEDAFTADGNDQHADMIQEQRDASISVRVERCGEMQVVASGEDVTQQEQVQPTQIEVMELRDDDPDVEDQKYVQQFPGVNPEVAIWHYLDPYGIIQGPFPLTMLKHWSDIGCYVEPRFKVWMVGQSPEEAVILVDLLRQFFPIQ